MLKKFKIGTGIGGLLMGIGLAIVMPIQAQGVNLVTNPGFESGETSWITPDTGDQTTTADKHSGSRSFLANGSNITATQGWIEVDTNKTYVLMVWYKWNSFSRSGSDWGYDKLEVIDGNWKTITRDINIHSNQLAGQWNKLAITFKPNTSQIRVSMGIEGTVTSAQIYWDDVELIEKAGNQLPTVSVTSSVTSAAAGTAVGFTASANDSDGAVEYYDWQFGDGTASREINPNHTYLGRGNYAASLTVYDNDGGKTTKTINITISDTVNPAVTITGPAATETYSTTSASIQISGTASVVSGSLAAINWDNTSTDEAGTITTAAGFTSSTIALKSGNNDILITAVDSNGRRGTDRITIYRQISGPTISNITAGAGSVKMYEKYETNFSVSTVADNFFFGYDPNPPMGVKTGNGVTVEGVISTPSKTVVQPAFYQTVVNRQTVNGTMKYVETATKQWYLRYSPQELGTHRVSIRVTDASGTATTLVGSFSATAATRPGYIGVSSNDPRYFRFSNGSIYWPIGPAWQENDDYNSYVGTGLNFERPWMGGKGAYSFNFARWANSGENAGNEGVMATVNYLEKYPTAELSYNLIYPTDFRYWISRWSAGEDLFQSVKPSTTYQIKLRLKTEGITGPRNSGYSQYGFTIRMHDWLGYQETPEVVDAALRSKPQMVPYITATADWSTLIYTFTTPSNINQINSDISLYLENVTGGKVYIDEFSMREKLAGGGLGGELIRDHRADAHMSVDPVGAAYFDHQIEEAEKSGVYLKYVVHDKNDWVQNHLVGAGLFTSVGDGYYQEENTKAFWLLKQWYRYLAARYGYSTAIHSWEFNNEGPPDDGTGTHSRNAQYFAHYIRSVDSHPHLATTSFWCCWVSGLWLNTTKYPDMNYADWHRYTEAQSEIDDIAGFVKTISDSAYETPVNKPVIIAETGMYLNGSPISAAGSSNPGIWYHDLLWSQLGAPSVTWPNYWERNHIEAISGNYRTISKPFAAFVNSLDVAGGGYTDVVSKLTNSNSNIRVFGQVNSTKKTAYLWVQNKNHNWNKSTPAAQSGTIALSGFTANTAYPVEKWDTYAGTFTSQSVTANASGVVTMTVSGLTTDLAYKIGTMGGSTTGTPTPTPVIKAGDANGDGVVDKNDYAIWLSHYLQSVSGRSNGDFNNDATVNGADYYIWYKNYGL